MIKNLDLINIKIGAIEHILKNTDDTLQFNTLKNLDRDTLAKVTGFIIGNNEHILKCLLPEIKKLIT
jgi:hypothetical protein